MGISSSLKDQVRFQLINIQDAPSILDHLSIVFLVHYHLFYSNYYYSYYVRSSFLLHFFLYFSSISLRLSVLRDI